MSKEIQIQAFRFLGGNRSEMDKRSERPASREWQEIVNKLASTVPNVFPTCPGPREIEQAKGLSFINVPMGKPGMRSHTVYFAIQAEGGRSFFNVLCFAYHEGDVSLRELAALSPYDWWIICKQLTASDTKLTLPEKNTGPELPEWDGKKALFFRVPGFGGSVIQGEFEDWREPLNPSSPPPYQPMPSPKPNPRPEKREILNKIYKRTKNVLAIIGLLAGPAVPCLIWQNYNQSCKIEKLEGENYNQSCEIKELKNEIKELKDEKIIQNCTSQKSANMIEKIKFSLSDCLQYLSVKLHDISQKFSN